MEDAQPKPAKPLLGKEERSKIMREAATRRWTKVRRAKAAAEAARNKPVRPVKALTKASQSKKRPAAPREFASALKTAEKRLGKAIQERAEAALKYAVLSAEIPSLQRLVIALKNPLGVVPEYGLTPALSLEQIVGDQPLPYQNPPMRPQPEIPLVPVPQQLHPANTLAQVVRGGGGAIGVDLPAEENEDQFLDESNAVTGGGGWR